MSGEPTVKAQCLPFSQIPHTTRLFTDFLAYSPTVQPFYPRSPHLSERLKDEASVSRYDPARRRRVSANLARQNKSWDASPQTFSKIARLRAGASCVVTGQQVGLFGGPTFALYKALTAVKLAEEATTAGVDAVPVFWLATSDHDLAEVNHVSIPGPDGLLRVVSTPSHGVPGAPVSDVRLGDEILPVVEEAAVLLGDSPATQLLRESYRPGETLGTAFARLYARLFAQWGVILLDASDPELHRVAEPLYRSAIERAAEVDAALLDRGQALDNAGYYQQVKGDAVFGAAFYLARWRAHCNPPARRRERAARPNLPSAENPEREFHAVGTVGPYLRAPGTLQPVRAAAPRGAGLSSAYARLHRRRRGDRVFRAGRRGVRSSARPCHAHRPTFLSNDRRLKTQRWLRQYNLTVPERFTG